MPVYPVLAKSVQIDSAVVTAAVIGLMWGLFKGIAWVIQKYSGPAVPAPPDHPSHWTDVTGEIRPVNNQECAARHAALTEELRKGTGRMAKINDSVQGVEKQLVRVNEQIGAGVDLRIQKTADESATREVGKHEDGPYHSGGGAKRR